MQRVPSLFQATKWVVDQSQEKGRIVLTGSQTYELMRGVSESLAGRIGILEISGLSLREIVGLPRGPRRYVPARLKKDDIAVPDGFDLWATIQRGSMPELIATDMPWDRFWSSYVRAYPERGVRSLVNLGDERKFYNFMIASAARSGQLYNASSIANEIVSRKLVYARQQVNNGSTTRRWPPP